MLIGCLYLPRKEGGRGLISIEDCVDIAELSLKEYVMRSKEKIISAARGNVTKEVKSAKAYKKRRKEEREASVWEKELHGQHFRQMKEVGAKESWTWLQRGELKKETEGMIMAAQSQSLKTNAIKARIDKSREDAKCRMCNEKEETIHHIVSGCSNLAQKEYKRRHDCVARALHWFTGIFYVSEDLKLVISGTNINLRALLKMNNSKYYGILQYRRILRYMREGQTL